MVDINQHRKERDVINKWKKSFYSTGLTGFTHTNNIENYPYEKPMIEHVHQINIKQIKNDFWERKCFKDQNTGRIYKEVEGVLHTVTDEGEPIGPLRSDIIINILDK